MPASPPSPVTDRQPKLAELIFEDLQREILRGDFAPGDRLPGERELARRFDANRHTLREALRRLEHARLITVRHGRGLTVADFRRSGTVDLLAPFLRARPTSPDSAAVLVDLLAARLQVLVLAVALAARRAEPADTARLEQIVDAQVAAFDAADRQRLVAGDLRLVDALVDAAHSLTVRWFANSLLEVYRGLAPRVVELWILEPTFPHYLRRLLAAVRAHDPRAASAATRDYYRRADARLLATRPLHIEEGGALHADP